MNGLTNQQWIDTIRQLRTQALDLLDGNVVLGKKLSGRLHALNRQPDRYWLRATVDLCDMLLDILTGVDSPQLDKLLDLRSLKAMEGAGE